MTNLEKVVVRKTSYPFKHYRKRLVVALEPGDLIAIRFERTQTTFRAPLSAMFIQLCRWTVEAERRLNANKRKAKRR
jgi:hypothetical protein